MKLTPTQLFPNEWTEIRFRGSPSLKEPTPLNNNELFDDSLLISQQQISKINYDGASAKLPVTLTEGMHISWDGSWEFPYDDVYRFTYTTDDGLRFYIDDYTKLIYLANGGLTWFDQAKTTYYVDIALSKGIHNIRVEWYNKIGTSPTAVFGWQPLTVKSNIIEITPSSGEIQRTYFKGSPAQVAPQTIWVANKSISYVSVGFFGSNGIIFNPPSMVLNPLESRSLDLTFDVTQLDLLDLGTNKISCEVQIAGGLNDILPFTPIPLPEFTGSYPIP